MLGRALLRMEREFDKHVAYCRDEPRAQYLLASDPDVNKYFQVLALFIWSSHLPFGLRVRRR